MKLLILLLPQIVFAAMANKITIHGRVHSFNQKEVTLLVKGKPFVVPREKFPKEAIFKPNQELDLEMSPNDLSEIK